MRNRILLTSLACGLLAAASAARADEVRTTHTTKILKRPGEQSPVVIRVSAGHEMKVLEEQGRWIKVEVEGHTGWVTRTSVDSTTEAREIQRNTRRRPFVDGRSLKRGFGGDAPDDRVGADATDADDDAADDKPAKARASSDDDGAASDDGDDAPAKPKKKVAAKKVKAHAASADDDADDDGDADAAPAKPKKAKHAKHASHASDDDGDADSDGDGDDDQAKEDAPPPPKMMTVTADEVDLRAKPSKHGKAVLTVGKGDRLAFVETSDDGKWVEVENEDGDAGWIRAKDVQEDGHAPREIRTDARLGFSEVSEAFKSDGTGNLANYNLGSGAVAVALGGSVDWKYGANYRIGAELGYVLGKATPGVRYTDGTSSVDIGFTTHDVDARLKAGYDLHSAKGTIIWGHLGYHYGMFSVDNVSDLTKNLAHLPSEILSGPTVGIAMDMPKLGEKVGARASADLLYPGTRTQTKGLEDGASSKVLAAWLSAVVSYQWKSDITLDAGYRLAWASTQWAGAATGSMRGTNSTTAQRTDMAHILTVGIAKSF